MEVRRNVGTLLAPLSRLASTGIRMRPGYLIVGAKRAGTTSLAEWVARHPRVAPCRSGKGSHYFDTNFRRGLAWYLAQFPKASDRWSITGEASPYYMYHPAAPARIAAVLPQVKMIAVLREPVNRAWSQYRYEVARGHEMADFSTALDLEPRRLQRERERLSSNPQYEGAAFRHHGYLERGRYVEQLERLYGFFPPEQVLVLQSEKLFADPAAELERVWHFLGLESAHLDNLRPHNANATIERIDQLNFKRLHDYYGPLNERLYDLPGIDFRWDSDSHE